jgi:hypothetical protein
MLSHVHLGALVLGTVLLAMALLLRRGAQARVRWFRLLGLFFAFFGLTTTAVTALGLVSWPPATVALGVLAGLLGAALARSLDR